MLRFDKATSLSLLFTIILSLRLSDSLWGSDVLLFFEFINVWKNGILILYYKFIELILLLYTFLVVSFAWYKEYIIWRI